MSRYIKRCTQCFTLLEQLRIAGADEHAWFETRPVYHLQDPGVQLYAHGLLPYMADPVAFADFRMHGERGRGPFIEIHVCGWVRP